MDGGEREERGRGGKYNEGKGMQKIMRNKRNKKNVDDNLIKMKINLI